LKLRHRFGIFAFVLLLALLPACGRPRQQVANEVKGDEIAALNSQMPTSAKWSVPQLSESGIMVEATWGEMSGFDFDYLRRSEHYGHLLRELNVSEPERLYSGTDFQVFLPRQEVSVGEVWSLSSENIHPFLSQFHPDFNTDLNMDASGAYALLKAVSPQRWDVMFRIHGQFSLEETVYITPAQFAGRLRINTEEGTVEAFELQIPEKRAFNLAYEAHGDGGSMAGLGFVTDMELRSVPPNDASHSWTEQLETADAEKALARSFYPFEKIEWQSLQSARTKARREGKNLFVLIIAGVLDDQSC
jgi:hypothetical protein